MPRSPRRAGERARCALRVNPDVDAGTHDKISTGKAENKFGVPIDRGGGDLRAAWRRSPGWRCAGWRSTSAASSSDLAPLETAFVKLGALMARAARARA